MSKNDFGLCHKSVSRAFCANNEENSEEEEENEEDEESFEILPIYNNSGIEYNEVRWVINKRWCLMINVMCPHSLVMVYYHNTAV